MREEIVFLSGTHLNKVKAEELRCKLGFDDMHVEESDRRAGGLLMFYNKENESGFELHGS